MCISLNVCCKQIYSVYILLLVSVVYIKEKFTYMWVGSQNIVSAICRGPLICTAIYISWTPETFRVGLPIISNMDMDNG